MRLAFSTTMTDPSCMSEADSVRPSWPERLEILDETEDWLVVNKPAGLLMHPTNPKLVPTLWNELRNLLSYERTVGGQISFINRLDRETSGIVLVAKNRESARSLTEALQGGRMEKEYLAITAGWPERETFECAEPILRQGTVMPSKIHLKQKVHPEGAPSRTLFRVLRRWERRKFPPGKFSLVEARPITGRTHQIRVHLAYLGYPIVGDKIYGPDEGCYLEFRETGWTERLESILYLRRHALHACRLTVDGGKEWRCDLPDELRTLMP